MRMKCYLENLRVLALVMFLGVVQFAFAQNSVSVNGLVSDQTGEPIIGATVLEVGTSNGASTDIDGKYRLQVKPGATIRFSEDNTCGCV